MSFPTQQSTQGTQRGPGTGPTSMMVAGVTVQFPCKAYPSQMAMMSKVITGLKQQKNCLLESPTGSGKSLALLCSAIAWQQHEAVRVDRINAEIDARHEAAVATLQAELAKKKQEQGGQAEPGVTPTPQPNESIPGVEAEAEKDSDSSFEVSMASLKSTPVYDLTDDDDDFKPSKRTRMSTTSNSGKNRSASSLLDSSISSGALSGDASMNQLNQISLDTNEPELKDSPYFVPCEKKLSVPKIFFGTRTHKQIAQITRELRKTGYSNVRSLVLASRDHTCINPLVEKLANKNEACNELIRNSSSTGKGCMWHQGARKLASFAALGSVGLQPGYDLEDLVRVGRQYKSCPYYVTRFLMQNADIIFCPYNYMIDPSIRQSMNLDLNGHVLIFDEAHNMEDASREASSFSLKQDELQRAMQDCEKVARVGAEPYAHSEISNLISHLSQWMDNQSPHLIEKSFNSSGKCWTGTEFLGIIHNFGLTEEKFKLAVTYFEAIHMQRDKQLEAQRERGSRFHDEKPVISNPTLAIVENVLRLFTELTRDSGRFRDDFRVAMSKDTVRTRRDGNAGPFRSAQVLSLHLWCLSSAIAFEYLKKSVHSIVLTSGTLSPMQSFESELGTPFPLKLEANHVIEDTQVWASVVGTGPRGINLNGSYQNAEQLGYQDELGSVILRTCEIMPHGVLCFFSSYRSLETLSNRWRTTGLLDRIDAIKTVVIEPRSGADAFQEAMDTFYGAVRESCRSGSSGGSDSKTGALFLAVCRGKVSEGLDFADNNARAVICIGIPFPNYRDMQVELKREYNNKNRQRGLLNGSDWYEIQAFRALNQALGRCIRHRNDWGAILLVDDRYIRTPRYKNSLSKWIRSSVKSFPNWQYLEHSLQQFKENMGSKSFPSNENSFMEMEQDENIAQVGGESSWMGMPKNYGQSNDFLGKDSAVQSFPFANSSSSGGNDGGDSDAVSQEDVQSVGNTDSFKIDRGRSDSFKQPSTPASIFSATSKRGSIQAKGNTLASMFARQVQKAQSPSPDKSNETLDKFNPNQISLEGPPPSENSVASGRTKRPRDKKLKL